MASFCTFFHSSPASKSNFPFLHHQTQPKLSHPTPLFSLAPPPPHSISSPQPQVLPTTTPLLPKRTDTMPMRTSVMRLVAAASSAANPRSFSSASNPPTPPPNPFVFSADYPPGSSLSPDQFNYCLQALKLFSGKLQIPNKINREFSQLQANRIRHSEMMSSWTVAFNNANLDKNRYFDVVPFDKNRVVLNSCKNYRPDAEGYINASFIKTSSSEDIS